MSIKNNMLYAMDNVCATAEALKILAPNDWERVNDTGDGVSWEDIVWKSSATINEEDLNAKVKSFDTKDVKTAWAIAGEKARKNLGL